MRIFIVSPYFICKNSKKKSLKERLNRLFVRLENANITKSKLHNLDSNIIILGVDGDNYEPSLNKLLDKNWENSYLREFPGTRGCALSHLLILKYIQKNKIYEDILIIEDDALINKNFLELIPTKFPDDYDIFIMHTYGLENYEKITTEVSKNIKKVTVYNKNYDAMSSYTYFINGRNIDKIVKEVIPLKWQIDISLTGGVNKNINTYILNPELEASGNEDFSYRKMLNAKNIYYHMQLQETSPILLDNNKFLHLEIHDSMINEISRYNPPLFNFYIENEEKELFLINQAIEIHFPEFFYINTNKFEIIKFRIKDESIFLKNQKFTLHVLYVNSEGLHGILKQDREKILDKNDKKFNQHIRYPNSGKEIVVSLDIISDNNF